MKKNVYIVLLACDPRHVCQSTASSTVINATNFELYIWYKVFQPPFCYKNMCSIVYVTFCVTYPTIMEFNNLWDIETEVNSLTRI